MGCRESLSLDFIQKQCGIGESVTMSQAAKDATQRASGFMIQDTAIALWKRETTELGLVVLNQVASGKQETDSRSDRAELSVIRTSRSFSELGFQHGTQDCGKSSAHQHCSISAPKVWLTGMVHPKDVICRGASLNQEQSKKPLPVGRAVLYSHQVPQWLHSPSFEEMIL